MTDIAGKSFEARFDHGHTLDIGAWVTPNDAIQGVVLERACSVEIEGEPFCVLRCVGVTRQELEYAQAAGVSRLPAAPPWSKGLSRDDR